jgi:hypothetical protein
MVLSFVISITLADRGEYRQVAKTKAALGRLSWSTVVSLDFMVSAPHADSGSYNRATT